MNARIKIILSALSVITATIVVAVVAQQGFAWTNPTSNPPFSNPVITTSGGNVGIGTTASGYKLDVNGNGRVGAGGAGYMYLGNRGYYIGDDLAGTDLQTNAPNIYVYEGSWKRLLREGDVSAGISGSGTTDYIPKWTSASALGNSQISDNGTTVNIANNLIANGAGSNFGTTGTCCASQTPTLGVSELTSSNNRLPWLQFHTGGFQEAFIRLAKDTRVFEMGDGQSVGVDLALLNGAGTRNVYLSPRGNSYFNSGNVGIGTTAPGAKLEIRDDSNWSSGWNNTLKVSSNFYPNIRFHSYNSGKTSMIGNDNDGGLWFGVNGADTYGDKIGMVILPSGNVGIGTMAPGSPLHIGTSGWSANQLHFSSGWGIGGYHATIGSGYSGIAAAGIMLGTPHVPWRVNYGAKLRFASDPAASYYWDWGMNGEAGGSADRFDLNRNNSNLLTVINNGNVGIGTTAPGYKLDVNGDIRAQNAWLRTTGNSGWYSDTWGGGWYMQDGTWIRGYNGKNLWMGSGLIGGDGGLTIGYGGAGAPGGGAIIAGNVGIGTTNPDVSVKLHVSGGGIGLDNNQAILAKTSWGVMGDIVRLDASNKLSIRGIGGGLQISDSGGNSQVFVNNSGNVGIGTTAPTYKLQVAGNSANSTGVWAVSSDERLKRDIMPIAGALQTITALQGVGFNWRDKAKDDQFGRVMGFVAQDVEKVLPQWVKTDADGYKRIETIGMDALLVEAIKEQQKQIEQKQDMVDDLTKRVKRLEALIK